MEKPTLAKIRTFQEDFERAKQQRQSRANSGANKPPPSILPTAPTKRSAAVNPPKPSPPPAPREKTTTVRTEPISPPPPSVIKASTPTPSTPKETDDEQFIPVDLEASLTSVGQPDRKSVLLEESDFDITDDNVSEGSIIRETKRERFRLIPAILKSVRGQFTNLRKKSDPEHTIRSAKSRADTITSAAVRKSLAPRDDLHEIADRLKRTGTKDAPRQSFAITSAKATTPHWKYRDKVEEEIADDQTIDSEITEQSPTPPTVPSTPTPEPTATASTPPPALATAVPEATRPELEVTPEKSPTPPPVLTPEPTPPTPERTEPAPTDSRSLWSWQLGAVALVAIVLGSGSSYWFFFRDAVMPAELTTTPTPTTNKQSATLISLSDNRDTLYQTILETPLQNTAWPFMVPYVETFGEPSAATVENLMTVIRWQAPGSFIRSVQTIRFGRISNQPFVVIGVDSFDTAFAGMLTWETHISRDLSPLFGRPITRSFDPRNPGVPTEAFFRDVVDSNRDVRVLYDANEVPRVTYTFVDRTTILIAPTSELFDSVIPLLR